MSLQFGWLLANKYTVLNKQPKIWTGATITKVTEQTFWIRMTRETILGTQMSPYDQIHKLTCDHVNSLPTKINLRKRKVRCENRGK